MTHWFIGAVAALALGTVGAAAQSYPSKNIQGVAQWGAGGATDSAMRTLTPQAEKALGGTVVMQNMTGGFGINALNYVAGKPADGYTLLMGTESPLIYKVMGRDQKDYGDFTPIDVLARGTAVLVARPDAPFDDYKGLLAYIQANQNVLLWGTTGPGGLPSVAKAMMDSVEGYLPVISVPYDSQGAALTAIEGGTLDVMPALLGNAIKGIRAGKLKPLVVFAIQPSKLLPKVPAILTFNGGYAKYLPWGPFFGVFAKKGTPNAIVAKLSAAYKKGAESPDFTKLMEGRGYTIMNVSGSKAQDFLTKSQEIVAWLMMENGDVKVQPDTLGIAQPGN